MSRSRIFVLAALLACGVSFAQAQDTPAPADEEQQKVALFLTLFEGMCPALLKAEFAKNPSLTELGAPVVESISGDACGCFLGELRILPTAQVAALFDGKTKAEEMEQMIGRCTVRSFKPHVGKMCMDYASGSGIEEAKSKPLCDCVHKRVGDSDDETLAGLIGKDDKDGFEALMAECAVE